MIWFNELLFPDIRLGLLARPLYEKKTRYQRLQIYDTRRLGRMLVLDGAVQTTERDEFIYHEMMSHPVFMLKPQAEKVLIIGGGDGGVLREVLKYKSVKAVYLVEIDKDVIAASKKYLKKICRGAFNDKRLKLVIDDGARFVEETAERFDIIIIDSSDPVGPAKVLFTKKFYSKIYSILTDKGVMIRQTGSSVFQPYEAAVNYKILKKIFPFAAIQIAAIPTYIGGFFTFVVASKGIDPRGLDMPGIVKRFNALALNTKYYNPQTHLGSTCLPEYIIRKL